MYTLKFQWKDGVWTTCEGNKNKEYLIKVGKTTVEKDDDYINFIVIKD